LTDFFTIISLTHSAVNLQ